MRVAALSAAVFLVTACAPVSELFRRAEKRGCELGAHAQRFVPAVERDGSRVVLPVTFPDGTRAELLYPRRLDLGRMTVRPYTSGTLDGESADFGRDFKIFRGDVEQVLASLNGCKRPPLLAEYRDTRGGRVGYWDLYQRGGQHELGFQFGRWAVLVYDYVSGPAAMSEGDRAAWVASFHGRETGGGFLVLRGTGPLRLARAGEHAGPQLTFSEPGRTIHLFPGRCDPHEGQTETVAGRRVSWHGWFADWCLSDSMRVHAEGRPRVVGPLIRALAVRNVRLAR